MNPSSVEDAGVHEVDMDVKRPSSHRWQTFQLRSLADKFDDVMGPRDWVLPASQGTDSRMQNGKYGLDSIRGMVKVLTRVEGS